MNDDQNTFRTVTVNVGRVIVGQPSQHLGWVTPTWHPYVVVPEQTGPCVYQRNQYAVDVGVHGLHYGTSDITGMAGFRQKDGSYAMFRLNDHVLRLEANMRAMDFQVPPGIRESVILCAGLGITALVSAEDVYVRAVAFGENTALGVGSKNEGQVVVFTRDMSQYVDPSGIDLLWPGLLLRRASPWSGMPFIKGASNYALNAWWKGKIAKKFGCDEVLCSSHDGSEIAETSGSIPVAFFHPRAGETVPTLVVPRFEAGRLNSITLDTIMRLALHLGWRIELHQVFNEDVLRRADELWLCGTWSGMVPVKQVWADAKYMYRPASPDLRIPPGVFEDGVGHGYARWLEQEFQPTPMGSDINGRPDTRGWHLWKQGHRYGEQLRDLYWAVVRMDRANLRGFVPPPDWHTPVEPLEAGNS